MKEGGTCTIFARPNLPIQNDVSLHNKGGLWDAFLRLADQCEPL